jgi:hypothetical protein
MAIKANLKLILITVTQIALMILYVYSPQYHESFASLDNIAYGHISHQLYLGNWQAFFNLTWSGMSPLVASLFQHLGMDVLPSLSAARILFSALALIVLNQITFKTNHTKQYQYGLIGVYSLLTFSIVQSVTDPALLLGLILFFYWLLYKKPTPTYTPTLIAISIFTGITRPVGFYLVLATLILTLLLKWRLNFLKHKSTLLPIAITITAVLLFVAAWATLFSKINHTSPTLGKTGNYNFRYISKLAPTVHYNSADQWKALAQVYNSDIQYQNQPALQHHPRSIHQWPWLDIAVHVNSKTNETKHLLQSTPASYLVKYYLANAYIFLKDYSWWILILLTVALNKKTQTNWWIFILVFAFYLNLLFISHIETRYLIPLIIVALLILHQEDHTVTWFSKKQILILLFVSLFQDTIQFTSYCAKSLLNQNPPKPYYLQQEIPQTTQYVSFETMRPAWLTVKNPNLIFLGTLKDSAQLHIISDKNIKLVTFHNDRAQFQRILP